MTNTQESYIQNTRDVITASKIKMASNNLLAYKIVYKDTPDDVASTLEEEKADHFSFWTLAHKILEQFNNENLTIQEIVDKFLEEYDITNQYQKKELLEMILKKEEERGMDEVDLRAKEKMLGKLTLDKLRQEYYWPEKYADLAQKPKITRAEARDLIIGSWDPRIADSILKVAVQNKDRDMKGKYDNEQRIQAQYKWFTLWAKPDRLILYYKETGERITMDEFKTLTEWMNRDEIHAFTKEKNIKWMIRDYKTVWDIASIRKEIQYAGDTKYWYISSMAFYYLIVWINTWIPCEARLDIIRKTKPFISYTEVINETLMLEKMKPIINILDKIVEAEKTWERGEISIEDIIENPMLSTYYPILMESIGTHTVYTDMV